MPTAARHQQSPAEVHSHNATASTRPPHPTGLGPQHELDSTASHRRRGQQHDRCLACDDHHRASLRPSARRRLRRLEGVSRPKPRAGRRLRRSAAVRRSATVGRTEPTTHRPHRTRRCERRSQRRGRSSAALAQVSAWNCPLSGEGPSGVHEGTVIDAIGRRPQEATHHARSRMGCTKAQSSTRSAGGRKQAPLGRGTEEGARRCGRRLRWLVTVRSLPPSGEGWSRRSARWDGGRPGRSGLRPGAGISSSGERGGSARQEGGAGQLVRRPRR